MSGDYGHSGTPAFNLTGRLVALGPLVREVVPVYQRWLNDLAHARNFEDTPQPWTTERTLALFEQRASASDDAIMFTLYELATNRPIGYAMLFGISWRHRSAEYAIHIGEGDVHGKGFGTEATRLMCGYAFERLGLNSVFLKVAAFNVAGQRAYLRAGFRESGRRRSAWWMGGQWWDEIIMDCLAGEYDGSHGV